MACFLVEEPAMGYIFAVIAIPLTLELTNMYIKEQEQNEKLKIVYHIKPKNDSTEDSKG